MLENKYFIITLGSPAIDPYLAFTVEGADTLRSNLSSPNKFVVKLPKGSEVPEMFNAWPEYDHAGIIIQMQGSDWTSETR